MIIARSSLQPNSKMVLTTFLCLLIFIYAVISWYLAKFFLRKIKKRKSQGQPFKRNVADLLIARPDNFSTYQFNSAVFFQNAPGCQSRPILLHLRLIFKVIFIHNTKYELWDVANKLPKKSASRLPKTGLGDSWKEGSTGLPCSLLR
jgi:hypothetical protein